VRDRNVPYGGFRAALWPTGHFKNLAAMVSGTTDQIIGSDAGATDTGGGEGTTRQGPTRSTVSAAPIRQEERFGDERIGQCIDGHRLPQALQREGCQGHPPGIVV